MSNPFISESEEQLLDDVKPTLQALMVYLTSESNGTRVYELMNYMDFRTGRMVHAMSNGRSYTRDEENKWYIETIVR
jgi:hypothetical protein